MASLAGKRILLTGDSHMEWSPFGSKLEKKLKDRGAVVTRLAIGGSAAFQWASGKPVCRTIEGGRKCLSTAELKAAGPFDLVIISLGTNDGANASAAKTDLAAAAKVAVADIKKMADAIGAPQTWWVGPPTMGPNESRATNDRSIPHYTNRNMEFVYAAGKPVFGAFTIDSRAANPGASDGDGVHVGSASGEKWAQLVVDKVAAGPSSFPIVPVAVVTAAVGVGLFVWWRRRR
jgi:lysophospholipase L1-like esterase